MNGRIEEIEETRIEIGFILINSIEMSDQDGSVFTLQTRDTCISDVHTDVHNLCTM